MDLEAGFCGIGKDHLALQTTPANEVGLPGPCLRRCPLLIAPLGVLCRLSCSSAGMFVSGAACCIAGVLASQQLQCCLPSLANALQVAECLGDSASSPAQVQPSQEGTPAPPSQLLQAPQALQEVIQATPPGVARLATRPPFLDITILGKLILHKRLQPIQATRQEGTPRRPAPLSAKPPPSPSPCGSDSGDTPLPRVSICPAWSEGGSLRTLQHPVLLHADLEQALGRLVFPC